jgi:hypothetical protein
MNPSTPTPMTPLPSVDEARLAHLERFLVSEVSGPADGLTVRHRRRVRRTVVTLAVAAALSVGIVGTVALAGGSGTAAAVAIERDDGWTTVRLNDRDVAPEEVLAELEAAGIEASIKTIVLAPMEEGDSIVFRINPDERDSGGVGAMAGRGLAPGGRGLVGITVDSLVPSFEVVPGDAIDDAPPGGVVESDVVPVEPDPAEALADLEARGIRLNLAGSVSIRDGAGHTVVLLVVE